VAMGLYALARSGDVEVRAMAPGRMGEAPAYGSAFARGSLVTWADGRIAYVSGTASVDACGHVVAPGDAVGQLGCMFGNLAALLAQSGLAMADVVSGTAYLARATDLAAFRAAAAHAGLPPTAPVAVVEADVCRREWLCEIEVVAARADRSA